ncbi:hypothetical protein SAMN04490244_102426 [Tranquillimonas rosea]|uniref:Uncharacterized protein n=2 Tax=Tranquillimonas rosea TaxID=641238 RepID=A0A1H9RS95_9RHOB|nr:hypothetical protein SAMN04490244_102426 [Tranquillimonas rosea]
MDPLPGRAGVLDALRAVGYRIGMAEKPSDPTRKTPKERENERDARLKKALRANLARRKAQARARKGRQDEQD